MLKKILGAVALILLLGVALLVVGLILLHRELNSESTREKIRQKASEVLGAEIQLAGVRVSLLGTVGLEGFVLPNSAPHETTPLLSVSSVEVRLGLWSLLQGRPTVESFSVNGVEATAYQTAEGSISLPFKPAPASAPDPAGVKEEKPSTPSKPLQLSVDQVKISRVNLRLLDPEKKILAAVEGLSLDGSASMSEGQPGARMNLMIETLIFTPGLKVTTLRSPLLYELGKVSLTKMEGQFVGGSLSGQASAKTLDAARPFEAGLLLRDGSMALLLKDSGADPDTLTGDLQWDFHGQGSLNAPKDLTGKGTVEIKQPVVGKLKNPIVPAGLVGLPALQSGQFDAIDGIYRVEGQKILVDELHIRSKGLNIDVNGDIGFDKTLNLKGRMKVDSGPVAKVADLAQSFMQGLFGGKKKDKEPEAGTPAPSAAPASESMKNGVPFTITGTTDKPVVRPEGNDPLNMLSMLAKALGFQVGDAPAPPPDPNSPNSGATADPAPSSGAPEAPPTLPPSPSP